jgi:hypothetical protein
MSTTNQTDIYGEITAERVRQDAKWGGPAHDDQHAEADFAGFILDRAKEWPSRKGFIQMAALAVAAVESMDRRGVTTITRPSDEGRCDLCGKPMPAGEEAFRFHYSGPCPSEAVTVNAVQERKP